MRSIMRVAGQVAVTCALVMGTCMPAWAIDSGTKDEAQRVEQTVGEGAAADQGPTVDEGDTATGDVAFDAADGEEAADLESPAADADESQDASLSSDADDAGGLALEADGEEALERAVTGMRTVVDGEYAIVVADGTDQVVDIMAASRESGANAALYVNTNSAHQKFQLTYQGNGFYKIAASHSGCVLTARAAADGTFGNGTNVEQQAWVGTDNQLWAVVETDGGWYRIVSKSSGLFLDVEGGHAGNSVNIQLWEPTDNNGGLGQKFRFQKMVSNGYYEVVSAADQGFSLGIAYASVANGANVELGARSQMQSQKFQIYYMGNGAYKLANLQSWMALDVVAGGKADGTNVTQWSQYATPNQAWIAEFQDDGSVKFKSAASGLYLDVEGGYAGATVNVQTWSASQTNGGLGQRWILVPTTRYRSSGDAELDGILESILPSHPTLSDCFYYVSSFRYISGSLYPTGAWSVPFAKEMYYRNGGNCYRFAALFCEMARALGYDARVVSGAVPAARGGTAPHGWVEIVQNGVRYVCDPDLNHEIPGRNWFMVTYDQAPCDYYF